MEKMTDFVFNFPVDENTVDTIHTLRNVRLHLARNMLGSVAQTVDEMIRRGLLAQEERANHILNLQRELLTKIASLEKRSPDSESIYSDELELYLDLLREPAAESSEG